MKALECYQHFSHFNIVGIFSDGKGQLTSQSVIKSGRISYSFEILWLFSLPPYPKFKLVQCVIVVLITGKNEEDPIKNGDTIVLTTL